MSMRSLDVLGVGEDLHLHLVDDGGIVVEELGMQDFAQVADLEAFVLGRLADADPVDVALAHVPDAFGAVDQVMDLAFQNRLEVRLHLAAGNFHPDADGQSRQVLGFRVNYDVVDLRADDGDLAVFHLGDLERGDVFEARRLVAAELDVGLLLADAFAFEGRAEGHRDRHLGDFDLAAANFQALLHDVVDGHVGNNMLVGANAGGQDLRNVGIGDGGEAVIDGARRRGIFLFRHFTQRHDEGEGAVLVVLQIASILAGLDAAEAESNAIGEAEGVDWQPRSPCRKEPGASPSPFPRRPPPTARRTMCRGYDRP